MRIFLQLGQHKLIRYWKVEGGVSMSGIVISASSDPFIVFGSRSMVVWYPCAGEVANTTHGTSNIRADAKGRGGSGFGWVETGEDNLFNLLALDAVFDLNERWSRKPTGGRTDTSSRTILAKEYHVICNVTTPTKATVSGFYVGRGTWGMESKEGNHKTCTNWFLACLGLESVRSTCCSSILLLCCLEATPCAAVVSTQYKIRIQ